MCVRTYIPRYLFASIPSEWLAPTTTVGIKFGTEDNSALLLTTFAKLDSTLLGGKLTSTELKRGGRSALTGIPCDVLGYHQTARPATERVFEYLRGLCIHSVQPSNCHQHRPHNLPLRPLTLSFCPRLLFYTHAGFDLPQQCVFFEGSTAIDRGFKIVRQMTPMASMTWRLNFLHSSRARNRLRKEHDTRVPLVSSPAVLQPAAIPSRARQFMSQTPILKESVEAGASGGSTAGAPETKDDATLPAWARQWSRRLPKTGPPRSCTEEAKAAHSVGARVGAPESKDDTDYVNPMYHGSVPPPVVGGPGDLTGIEMKATTAERSATTAPRSPRRGGIASTGRAAPLQDGQQRTVHPVFAMATAVLISVCFIIEVSSLLATSLNCQPTIAGNPTIQCLRFVALPFSPTTRCPCYLLRVSGAPPRHANTNNSAADVVDWDDGDLAPGLNNSSTTYSDLERFLASEQAGNLAGLFVYVKLRATEACTE